MKITKANAENIASNMVGFCAPGITEMQEARIGMKQGKKYVMKSYTVGGWLHGDYATCDSLQKKLRRAIVAVLIEAELPEGTHVAEARRKYR